MSLVRMCTVTVSLFRMCMCMCLRARERERREASTKASNAELVPISVDSSKDLCTEKAELELRITTEHSQLLEKPFNVLNEVNLPPFVQSDDLKSIVGPYSPKRQLVNCRELLQEKPNKVQPWTGLQWLSNIVSEEDEQFARQEGPRVIVEEAEEEDRQPVGNPFESPIPTHTLAWSDYDSCVVGSPIFNAYQHQQTPDGEPLWTQSVEVEGVDEKLKTLVDELLEKDKTTHPHEACLADSRGSCQCSQLPNQILATVTSTCTINLLIEELKEELTSAGGAGEQVRSRPRAHVG